MIYRLKLAFKLEKNSITIRHNNLFASFIKKCLSQEYPEVFKKLYSSNISKPFTFASYLPGAKPDGEVFVLTNDICNVVISSSDSAFLIELQACLRKNKFKPYPMPLGNTMMLVSVDFELLKEITEDKVIIKFLSPLLVRNHNRETNKDFYLDYTSPDFEEKLNIIVKNQIGKDVSISLKPVNAHRTVVNCLDDKVNCSYGIFELSGDVDVINKLYKDGIGSKRSCGFGCFNILSKGA